MNPSTTNRSQQEARVRAVETIDWLMRSLLPEVLDNASWNVWAAELRALAEFDREMLGNRYAMRHALNTMRELRTEVSAAMTAEWAFARDLRRPSTLVVEGGAGAFRRRRLPHLDELIDLTCAATPSSGLGVILRATTHNAINLAVTSADNDEDLQRIDALEGTYATQLRALVDLAAQSAAAAGRPRRAGTPWADSRFSVEEVRLVTSHRAAFEGIYHYDAESIRCGHRHQRPAAAHACVIALEKRMTGASGAHA